MTDAALEAIIRDQTAALRSASGTFLELAKHLRARGDAGHASLAQGRAEFTAMVADNADRDMQGDPR